MPEQLIDPSPADPVVSTSQPLTYHTVHEQLKQLPEDHPGRLLVPHLERLSATQATADQARMQDNEPIRPTAAETTPLGDDLAAAYGTAMQDTSEILEAEPPLPEDNQEKPKEPTLPTLSQIIDELRGENRKREYENTSGSHIPLNVLRAILSTGDYSPEELAEVVNQARLAKDRDAELERSRGKDHQPDYDRIFWAIEVAPLDKLQGAYHLPELSSALHHIHEHADSIYGVGAALTSLQKVYGFDDPLDLYEPGGSAAADPTVRAVIANEYSAWLVSETLMKHIAMWPEDDHPFDETLAKRNWADRYLQLVVGLPEELSGELLFATYSQTTNKEDGYINSIALQHRLEETYRSTCNLTTEQIVQLREVAGIVNFGNYFSDQLEFMSRFINGDPAAIEHLERGDTTVVLTDSKGDHNGAMRDTNVEFDAGNYHTLFFEINRPSDFYRHLLTVARHGIKPSTLVIAAHGSPGKMRFGDGNDGSFSLINAGRMPDMLPSIVWQYVPEAHGLETIVHDMMQDSRGIDDNPESKGRRRIILKSCAQAKPLTVLRLHTPGQRWDQDFKAYDYGRPLADGNILIGKESMAGTVTKVANDPNLDVYAGEHDLSIIQTPHGIQFETSVETPDHKEVNVPFDATHYKLDAHGNLVEERIAEIKLRNVNPAAENSDEEEDGNE